MGQAFRGPKSALPWLLALCQRKRKLAFGGAGRAHSAPGLAVSRGCRGREAPKRRDPCATFRQDLNSGPGRGPDA